MEIICILLFLYWLVLLVRVISSWLPRPSGGPMATGLSFVYQVTEPVLRPLRNMIPPIRMGMFAIDISIIVVFIVISILQSTLCRGV